MTVHVVINFPICFTINVVFYKPFSFFTRLMCNLFLPIVEYQAPAESSSESDQISFPLAADESKAVSTLAFFSFHVIVE